LTPTHVVYTAMGSLGLGGGHRVSGAPVLFAQPKKGGKPKQIGSDLIGWCATSGAALFCKANDQLVYLPTLAAEPERIGPSDELEPLLASGEVLYAGDRNNGTLVRFSRNGAAWKSTTIAEGQDLTRAVVVGDESSIYWVDAKRQTLMKAHR